MKRLSWITILLALPGCVDSAMGPEAPVEMQASLIPYADYVVVRTIQEPVADLASLFFRMNGSGVVVAEAYPQTSATAVGALVVWDPSGTPTVHTVPPPYEWARIHHLTESGLVVGDLGAIGRRSEAFLFDVGTGAFQLLSPPEGAGGTMATSANDAGDLTVVADFQDSDTGWWFARSFLYRDGVYLPLPNPGGHQNLWAGQLTPDGSILLKGTSQTPEFTYQSYLWRKGAVTPLDLPTGCDAAALIRHNLVGGACTGGRFMIFENGEATLFGGDEETNFTEVNGWARNGAILPHSEKVPYSWVYWPSGKLRAFPEGVSARAINAEGEILVRIGAFAGQLAIVRLVEAP